MTKKLDVSSIIVAHLKTLRNNRTGKVSLLDIFVFFGLPALVSAAAWYFNYPVDKDVANLILPSISIFAGLLINAIFVLYTVVIPKTLSQDEKDLIEEIFPNLLFAIIVSLAAIFSTAISAELSGTPQKWASAIAFYLTSNFLLTLLMTIKRIYALLDDQFT